MARNMPLGQHVGGDRTQPKPCYLLFFYAGAILWWLLARRVQDVCCSLCCQQAAAPATPSLPPATKQKYNLQRPLFPIFHLFSLPFSEENYFWPLEFIMLPNSDRFRVEGVIYDRWRIWMRPETVYDEEITAAVVWFFEGNVYIHKS